jgi:hypothetical protein
VSDSDHPGTKKNILVRVDIDLNHDGRFDVCRHFDDNGKVSKEEIDLDYDGHVDEWCTYENGVIVELDQDINNTGKPTIVRRYKDGKLAQKEVDSGSGQTDRWEYYDGNVLDRIGIDNDHDGKVDHWIKRASN